MAESTIPDLKKQVKELEKVIRKSTLSIRHGVEGLVETNTEDVEKVVGKLSHILQENLDFITGNFEVMRVEDDPGLDENNIFWEKEQDLFNIECQLNKEKEYDALPLFTNHQVEDLMSYLEQETKKANKNLKQMEQHLNIIKEQSVMLDQALDSVNNLTACLMDHEADLASGNSDPKSQSGVLSAKYQSLKTLENDRLKKLGLVCENLFPAPDHYDVLSPKSDNGIDIRMKSMADILELLLNRYFNFRHDPWVALDETFWVSHVNTLRSVGIIKTNGRNRNLIALDCDI